ncbi:hypothetical protein EUGRSUZ_J00932 [Eucalyptus grandis]|uniref:Uncharacterized protein n=2 Tax=Eucalyptus grandis TaxID=71139 RepID=A0ACC3J5K2_EUCGR|nr:hypothetical protein EUGRSUZ_J00932 [Eucalyptus grandis]
MIHFVKILELTRLLMLNGEGAKSAATICTSLEDSQMLKNFLVRGQQNTWTAKRPKKSQQKLLKNRKMQKNAEKLRRDQIFREKPQQA